MARYSHLPVYKLTYVLTREIFKLQQKLPKTLKFTLGQMMFESALRCLKGIIVANGSKNKLKPLQEVLLETETIWTYLRLMNDLKGISTGEFQNLSERLTDIGPQLNAWIKWEKTQIKNAEKVEEKFSEKRS